MPPETPEDQPPSARPSAALLIIGDEILSGRTQDSNLSHIAGWLGETGIDMQEARVVPDDAARIVEAVNALRVRYTYLFTTGGIGPTHDDITAECIAMAFGVPLERHPQAFAVLKAHYGAENFTPARQRMARVPQGGVLIDNPVSFAPGFQIGNVFVMAGVPKIMQGMLEGVRPRLRGAVPVSTRSLTILAPESVIADALAATAGRHPGVSIGSYPFFGRSETGGKSGVQVVVRSADAGAVAAALDDVRAHATQEGFTHFEDKAP